MRLLLIIIFFIALSLYSYSQTEKDLIIKSLDSAKSISWSSPDLSINLAKKLEKKSKNNNYIEGIVYSLRIQSLAYYIKGSYDFALEKGIEAIKISEKNNYTFGLGSVTNNLGLIYQDLGQYKKSIEYFDKSIKYAKINNRSFDTPINNKANSYYFLKDYKKSLEFHNIALKIREKARDSLGIADCKNDIGLIYLDLKKYNLAIKLISECYEIKESIIDTEGIAFSSLDLARAYLESNQPSKALKYINRGNKIAKLMNSPRYIIDSYELYAKYYFLINDGINAYKYQVRYTNIFDSIKSNESIKKIAEMQTKYETAKKEQSLKIKTYELKNEKLISNKKTNQRNLVTVAFIIMLLFGIIIFRNYKQKKKANIILNTQKKEIEEKNEELNQLVEEITTQRDEIKTQKTNVENQKIIIEKIFSDIEQSIDYAKKLQQSILPDEKLLDKYLTEHFILFKPKDKVSGDFYWWSHVENHTIITAADCTGHGVPGAFMSMLGVSFLREIVQKEYITHTGVILRKLRKEVIKALRQTGESGEQKDGMDMSIISINHETNSIQFSGANNSLFIVKKGELQINNKNSIKIFESNKQPNLKLYEITADKMPIAIYDKMDNFTSHEIKIEKGDQIYMFSDGYADQFGGPKGKKLKYKPFKQIILENANKPMTEQNKIINETFNTWKGSLEQVDDVLILGIKL